MSTFVTADDLPQLSVDVAAAGQAALANRAYARLLASGTAVTARQYIDVLAERGLSEEGARARIKRARHHRQLITVTHDGETVIPSFQLADDFELDPGASKAVAALLGAGYSAWDIWDWAQTPNGWIGRATPAQTIRTGDHVAVQKAVDAAVGDGPDA